MTLTLYSRFGTTPGTEQEITSGFSLLSQDVNPNISSMDYPVQIPLVDNINTSYERYVCFGQINIPDNKKLNNFKVYLNTVLGSGYKLFFKSTETYSSPNQYNTLGWNTEYTEIPTTEPTTCNLGGSLVWDGEQSQRTDYGVFVMELGNNQQASLSNFEILVSYDEVDDTDPDPFPSPFVETTSTGGQDPMFVFAIS